MKRYSSSILLMLLPGLLGAATLESVSGQLSYAAYNPTFTGLKGVYDTAAKTLTITNFVGSDGQVYGASDEYALVFNDVADGMDCKAEYSLADATYYYTSSMNSLRDIIGTATITDDTIVINYASVSSGTSIYFLSADGKQQAPGTSGVQQFRFTFTFEDDLDTVVGDLTLGASLENITSNAATVNYNLSWTGGQAPENLEDYTVTVTGDNNFQTVTTSGTNTTGTIELSNLEYATPYIFNVSAEVTADDKTYNSKTVTLQLVPVLENGLAIEITAPETTTSTSVDVTYTINYGTVSAGTPVFVNIVGDNDFETISVQATAATGTVTLNGLEPGISYSFIAQTSANVGSGNYIFSPVQHFAVTTTEGGTPLAVEYAEVDNGETTATITGAVTSDLDPATPVKVYYIQVQQ